jgi:hypothetical protein
MSCAENVLDPTARESAESLYGVELDEDNFVLFDD